MSVAQFIVFILDPFKQMSCLADRTAYWAAVCPFNQLSSEWADSATDNCQGERKPG